MGERGEVVRSIMESGVFDDLKKRVLEELKKSPGLKAFVSEAAEGSKTLQGVNLKEHRDRKKLLDELQKELQDKLMERASRLIWDMLLSKDSKIADDIDAKVHEVLCELAIKSRPTQQESFAAAAQAPPPHQHQHQHQSSASKQYGIYEPTGQGQAKMPQR